MLARRADVDTERSKEGWPHLPQLGGAEGGRGRVGIRAYYADGRGRRGSPSGARLNGKGGRAEKTVAGSRPQGFGSAGA
ncbi:hypothetical protein E2562_031692 [Oryza meyeriana var. granulata]|uniref:Uncharacterized protein n=1 Tax=Oryza meyeriana var. granulata TaxID=110450 RepID=A0A6G1E5K3_9ORYZ|nr:hypothetical protein E2562_031692 [Oryza meyeriana var. granulata]